MAFAHYCINFYIIGHHEVPPLAHTTMLREFPANLQHSNEAVIPPRAPTSPVSSASYYHQRYVSPQGIHIFKLLRQL